MYKCTFSCIMLRSDRNIVVHWWGRVAVNGTITRFNYIYIYIIFFFSCGAAAQRRQWPNSWGFYITHDAPQSVGLLWTRDQRVAETSTWQHTTLTTDKYPSPGGIRTHDLSRERALTYALDRASIMLAMFIESNTTRTHSFVYFMQWSPSEANLSSASQEVSRMLWNPKVNWHSRKFPPPVPILSQLGSVHTPTSHLLKIHFSIIFPSTRGSPKLYLYLRFPQNDPLYTSPLTLNALHAPPISFFSILSTEQCWVRRTYPTLPSR